jgi:hypothetical protein
VRGPLADNLTKSGFAVRNRHGGRTDSESGRSSVALTPATAVSPEERESTVEVLNAKSEALRSFVERLTAMVGGGMGAIKSRIVGNTEVGPD